jgi:hypothetical protein
MDELKGNRMIPDQIPAMRADLEQVREQHAIRDEIIERAQIELAKQASLQETMVETMGKPQSIVEMRSEALEKQIKKQKTGASSAGALEGGTGESGGTGELEGGASSSTAAPRGRGRPPHADRGSTSEQPRSRPQEPREASAPRLTTSGTPFDNNTSKAYWKHSTRSIGYIHDQLQFRGVRVAEELKNREDPRTGAKLKPDRKKDLLALLFDLISKKQWVR